MTDFALNLCYLRESKRSLQKNLAELLGVSVRQYQRYEKGEQEPCIQNLIALADYFDVSLDYLVGRNNNPDSRKL
jgi:transcriptional regulator with XRE-family HTH domain